jgi:ribA/ribD-fused uncharacterized protein
VTLNGICVGGGAVLFPAHLISSAVKQEKFQFSVVCDDKRFEEEVPRDHIHFPSDVGLKNAKLKDLCVVYFRDMIVKRVISQHFTREEISFGMFTKNKDAVILKPAFGETIPRVNYACPTTSIVNLSEQNYTDDRRAYVSRLYKVSNLGIASTLSNGDCGSLLVAKENGALRICGIYVAGSATNTMFQPVLKEDVDALMKFKNKCQGLLKHPEVNPDGASGSVDYNALSFGTYAYDSPNLRAISPSEIVPSRVGVENPELFGHSSTAAPAVLSIESAQKAANKKWHEGGTLDLATIEKAKNYVEALYAGHIKDCRSGSADNGVTGACNYGCLTGLDLSTSPGLPWKAWSKGRKGKSWMFTEDQKMKPFLENAVNDVLESWKDGYAYPVMFNATLKDERRTLDRVAAKKTRVFTAGSVEKTIADRSLFADFIVQFKTHRLDLMHCYGINASSLEWNDMAWIHRQMGSRHAAADYSGYDASLTAQLISHAYEVIARFYPNEVDRRMIDCSSVECRNHFVYMFGEVYQCAQGNPSGCAMTTVVNSVINHLLLSYAWIRHFTREGHNDMVSYQAWRKNFVCHVYGDDFIYTVSDAARSFTCKAYAEALRETGQEITAPDKSETIRDFIPWGELSLLKRSFVVNPFDGPSTLYVGALDKDVIEEIPRWTHRDNDEVANVSTVAATLQAAALWGRKYFDKIVSGIRETQTGSRLLSQVCAEDVFKDVSKPYTSSVSVDVRPVVAFYMADKDTNANDRAFSNLCNSYNFDYTTDGKTVVVNSAEQAYGMRKALAFDNMASFKAIRNCRLPGEIARLTHRIKGSWKQTQDWNLMRLDIMEGVLRAKFSVPEYNSLLAATGNAQLIEASPKDIFWGAGATVRECRGNPEKTKGANHLGRLLMKIRAG